MLQLLLGCVKQSPEHWALCVSLSTSWREGARSQVETNPAALHTHLWLLTMRRITMPGPVIGMISIHITPNSNVTCCEVDSKGMNSDLFCIVLTAYPM